jgi:hypothetical protein
MSMHKWAWAWLGTAAAALGGPAASQDVPSGNDQAPIVVHGQRDRDVEIRELVDSLTPAPANGHVSRFEHAACPAALGLPPAQRAQVVARMRAVGEAARVPLGSANCRANVVVMVKTNKRQLLEQLARRFPHYLGELSGGRLTRLMQSPEPTALWHLDGLVDADGRALFAAGGNVVVQRTTRASSRITDLAHHEFTGSVLIVEANALTGLTTTQLADYAAMRTFTGADPARLPNRGLPTILTMIDAPMDSAVPITLTSWDLAFLESLYASDVNIHAPGQRGEIQAGMRRSLERTGEHEGHN